MKKNALINLLLIMIFTNCNRDLQTLPSTLNLYSTKPLLFAETEIVLKKNYYY